MWVQNVEMTALKMLNMSISAGLVAYTVRKRSLEAVKKLMAPAETPEAAAARVVSTLRGGKTGEDGDDDDDLLVSNTVISLKDPLSGTRVQIPARSVTGTLPCCLQ